MIYKYETRPVHRARQLFRSARLRAGAMNDDRLRQRRQGVVDQRRRWRPFGRPTAARRRSKSCAKALSIWPYRDARPIYGPYTGRSKALLAPQGCGDTATRNGSRTSGRRRRFSIESRPETSHRLLSF